MKNKLFSLTDMIKLCNDSELSEPYIRYLCGIEPDHQYKHQEIIDVSILLNNILIDPNKLNGFLYSYVVPQLNREFDLLKISETDCLNIELKSGSVTFEKMQRQANGSIIRNIDSFYRDGARLGVRVLYEKIARRFGTACACRLCRRSDGGGVDLESADSRHRAVGGHGKAVVPSRLYRLLGRRAVFAPA